MKTPLFTARSQQVPQVISTTRSRFDHFWWAGTAVLIVLGAYAAAYSADQASNDRMVADARTVAAAYEAGRTAGRAELLPTVRQAWQAGLEEARGQCRAKAL